MSLWVIGICLLIILIIGVFWISFRITCIECDLSTLKSGMTDWVTHDHLATVLSQQPNSTS